MRIQRASVPGVRSRLGGIVLGLLALAATVPHPLEARVSEAEPLFSARSARYLHASRAHVAPIPAFARLYGTGCSTCHIAAPKLNVLGEAFRLAGYRLPDTDLLVRRDGPVPLGAEPWKEAWPRAIWPSDLPGISPFSARIETDVRAWRGGGRDASATYRFPNEIYLLAGAPLGESVSAFLESEWGQERGFTVVQAKVGFRDVIPGMPTGSANLWLGRLNPFLFTFTDRQIDRVGVNAFSWQSFRLSAAPLVGVDEGARAAKNDVTLGFGMQAAELNGVVGRRLHYGLGLAQGSPGTVEDSNGSKDVYYRLRYKFGGLDLKGRYSQGGGPVPGTGGQLLDRSLTLEHFSYFGNESTAADPQGSHGATGVALRLLQGPWDVGVGWVGRWYERPFGTASGDVRARTWFAKADYLLFPWVMTSVKYDRLDLSADASALPTGFGLGRSDHHSIAPTLTFLVRLNVRATVETRFLLDGDGRWPLGRSRPMDLFARLDVNF